MKKENLRWWSSNYSTKEKINFVRDRIFLPKKTENHGLRRIYTHNKYISKHLDSDIIIGFLGDIMPINNKELLISETLKKELASLDILVINLEGIIFHRSRFLALSHNLSILRKIKKLSANADIIINLANNHSADFGKDQFFKSKNIIENYGFQTFGYIDKPYIDIKDLRLYGASCWSNQKISLVNSFKLSDAHIINNFCSENKVNIFLAHWGYEMQLFPHKKQIEFSTNMKNWDLVIGNHPHCPQPIAYNTYKPFVIAYSLGNFCYSHYNPNHYGGAFLKVKLSTSKKVENIINSTKFILTEMIIHKKNIFIKDVDKINYMALRRNMISKKLILTKRQTKYE